MTIAPRDWLTSGLATAPGEEFLRWLVRHLARTLGCEWAFVWERCGERWERARVVAASHRGEPSALELELELGDRSPGLADVSELPGLRDSRNGGCAAIAIADGAGRPLGHFALVDAKPLADRAEWMAALHDFQVRVAGELSARRAVRELELLLATARAPSGEQTLRELAAALSRSLHAKMGFVCELLPVLPLRARMLAISIDGRDQPPIEYDLADTPCAAVYDRALHFEPDHVQGSFPKDSYLREIGASSFLGVRLDDGDGRPMGHFGVIHDAPLDPRIATLPVIRLFADRAAAELARMRAERERLRVERQLHDAQEHESLGRLARGIANDFNNLLVGILGQVTLALAGTDLLGSVRGHLEEIESAARRAAGLARQMLAYSGRGALDAPPRELAARREPPAAARAAAFPGGLVLVVDDEELVRATTKRMLERLGFKVRVVSDGRAGVEAFAEQCGELRLVLLDLTMPRLSGDEALREMRRVKRDVPVILTSGHSRREATQKLRDATFAGFLQKPFGLDDLERCVRAALDSGAAAEAQ